MDRHNARNNELLRNSNNLFNQASNLSDNEMFAIKRKAWLNDGMIVLNAEQIAKLGLLEKSMLEIATNRIYGKRK